jgi:DsbC/DsbD-like thiol-disulfide interchange protein
MLDWLLLLAVLVQGPATKPIETAHLTMAASATPAGKKVTLALDVTPKPKMHVYSPGQEGVIAISLTLDPNPVVTAAKAKYPVGEKLFMPALNETQLVYGKPFRITQDVTVTSRSGAPLIIKGTVRYQACDDKICYRPVTIPVEWNISR